MQFSYSPDNYSLNESIGYLISRARSLLAHDLDHALAEFEITHAQFGILRKLMDSAGDMTAGDLAREWHYDSGAMTRMLDRLEEKGLLRRKRSQTDRRSVLVRLSAKGRALDEHISRVAIEVLNSRLQEFSAQEADQFKDFLRRMIAHG